ncbi:MAG TPA: oligopeptide/dipeptide ABC transporter ATP-binding protein [Bacillota bacterium]|nr:oligopeptide/dipeptide ABC transporter ATP-binding protein [Bacillota bacterium]
MADECILELQGIKKYFPMGKGNQLKAVDNINLCLKKGETLGLVGESGCGKSTVGRTIVGLYKPTAGKILFAGKEISHLSGRELKQVRRNLQMIFQDPYASLNPRMTVGDIIGEALDIHGLARGAEREMRVLELLGLVGLNAEHANRFPHEFSGGQRQRVGIARALAVNPQVIICDEPISALDVSIQAQVVNLLKELQNRLGLTYLFIAHDLSMVQYISDRVAVMYLGQVVELAESCELYENPLHPYTQGLMAAIPVADPETARRHESPGLQGDTSEGGNGRQGCQFAPRCPKVSQVCTRQAPVYREVRPSHYLSCHMVF